MCWGDATANAPEIPLNNRRQGSWFDRGLDLARRAQRRGLLSRRPLSAADHGTASTHDESMNFRSFKPANGAPKPVKDGRLSTPYGAPPPAAEGH